MPTSAGPESLYIHVPFCGFMCHYCDFAKTALFDDKLVKDYFAKISEQTKNLRGIFSHPMRTVFLGGGTPGLFTTEYEGLRQALAGWLAPDCEFTMEVNPKNISRENLASWRALGVNRVSIGVQTFDEAGLKFLTRDHSGDAAREAIHLACSEMGNVNVDLIYGWRGQSLISWQRDLTIVADSGVQHVSLYNLTYEGATPMARAFRRGSLYEEPEDLQEELYESARKNLGQCGFEHEEVSNWARPGFASRHNWVYWKGLEYLAVGAGAHGFVKEDESDVVGTRYGFVKDVRKFLKVSCDQGGGENKSGSKNLKNWIASTGAEVESGRGLRERAMELVATQLRTKNGLNVQAVEKILKRPLRMCEVLERGLNDGKIEFREGLLKLAPAEWFREGAWAQRLLNGFNL